MARGTKSGNGATSVITWEPERRKDKLVVDGHELTAGESVELPAERAAEVMRSVAGVTMNGPAAEPLPPETAADEPQEPEATGEGSPDTTDAT